MPLGISIIVPTYRECGNLKELVEGVFTAFDNRKKEFSGSVAFIEMIIVDDNSQDGSAELIENVLSKRYAVRILVRTKERGLSSAVLAGFHIARGDIFVVMDADLQHPCEKVPDMICPFIQNHQTQCVLGQRILPASSTWPLYRRVISWGATKLAFLLTYGSMSDPMTGFFAIRRKQYEVNRSVISPIGYKIALEIFVKSQFGKKDVREVSFVFGERSVGESKLTKKVVIEYVKHLAELYRFKFLVVNKYLTLCFCFVWVLMALFICIR